MEKNKKPQIQVLKKLLTLFFSKPITREGLYRGFFSLFDHTRRKDGVILGMLLNTRLIAIHLSKWCTRKFSFLKFLQHFNLKNVGVLNVC